jgi:predicted  nucleic acid-binding Zn-ribbon protein
MKKETKTIIVFLIVFIIAFIFAIKFDYSIDSKRIKALETEIKIIKLDREELRKSCGSVLDMANEMSNKMSGKIDIIGDLEWDIQVLKKDRSYLFDVLRHNGFEIKEK